MAQHRLPPEERWRPPKKGQNNFEHIYIGGDNHALIRWTSTHIGQPPKPVQHATMKTQPIGHPPPNKCTEQPRPTSEVQQNGRCLAKTCDIATNSSKTQVPPKNGFQSLSSQHKRQSKWQWTCPLPALWHKDDLDMFSYSDRGSIKKTSHYRPIYLMACLSIISTYD